MTSGESPANSACSLLDFSRLLGFDHPARHEGDQEAGTLFETVASIQNKVGEPVPE